MTEGAAAKRIGALILAAGRGRRFGADKRGAPLPDGRALLDATLDAWSGVFDVLRVVVRLEDSALIQRLARSHPDVLVVPAPRAAEGMGGSLADGIRASRDLDAVFIGLGDMPAVRRETLLRLRDAMRQARSPDAVVRPTHAGRPGQPVGFGRGWFPSLGMSSGDVGARNLLAGARSIELVDVEDPGVLLDVDRPGDLERLASG